MQQIADDANNVGNILCSHNERYIEETNTVPVTINSCNVTLQWEMISSSLSNQESHCQINFNQLYI